MPSTVMGSEALTLPADTTGNRPTGVTGMIRFNTTSGYAEYFDGSAWNSIASPYTANLLLVAGGGGGGINGPGPGSGAGAGAGGMIATTANILPTVTYPIFIYLVTVIIQLVVTGTGTYFMVVDNDRVGT